MNTYHIRYIPNRGWQVTHTLSNGSEEKVGPLHSDENMAEQYLEHLAGHPYGPGEVEGFEWGEEVLDDEYDPGPEN